MHAFLPRALPGALELLTELALDLRWTWNHKGDALWRALDPVTWDRTRNAWLILQMVSHSRLEELAGDAWFRDELARLAAERKEYLSQPTWYGTAHPAAARSVAFFSMEFGLGQPLPLYAGGLGILAGDYLKTASDLGIPLVGVGLLYQEGYFRQILDAGGVQREMYPFNDPSGMPIQPLQSPQGGWLQISLQLPGRTLFLRVWLAQVGRAALFLLDSNHPLNSAPDRGITGKLYGAGREMRLLQEIVLGIGGWRMLEAAGVPVDVCHLNEGHAALVVLERARSFMLQQGTNFWEALWATRAGNVFTTHTPVVAGFDSFAPELIEKYISHVPDYVRAMGITVDEFLGLGRKNAGDLREPVSMAFLAARGCGTINGVSRLHGAVSRRIFQPLYQRWPEDEVPVAHVTNGVHVPSWDSAEADELWTRSCGKDRWLDGTESLRTGIESLSDESLWELRAAERGVLVRRARARLAMQWGQRGADADKVALASQVLDPNALTIGFARRFTEYKRPDLLLHDPERLRRLLLNPTCPVQILIAGKAHPEDALGKQLLQAWIRFMEDSAIRNVAVFLEDYDIELAQELVQGVDLWMNTPRRPWEACGTSGMKVLVNGGLNLSESDGWWAEVCDPQCGWTLGDGQEHSEPDWDAREADQLYQLLEQEIVPMFYDRDAGGVPRGWIERMRASMSRLAPRFSSNRMAKEYVERIYLPAARAVRERMAGNGELARTLHAWWTSLKQHWGQVRFGQLTAQPNGQEWNFSVQVYLGEVAPDWVQVQLYAEGSGAEQPALQIAMERHAPIPGAANGYVYRAAAPASRAESDFTPRIIPHHPQARVPLEAPLILWRQ